MEFIMKKIILFLAITLFMVVQVQADTVYSGQATASTSAQGFSTVPANTKSASIHVTGGAIRWTTYGTPTASSGNELQPGSSITLPSFHDVKSFRFILDEDSDSASVEYNLCKSRTCIEVYESGAMIVDHTGTTNEESAAVTGPGLFYGLIFTADNSSGVTFHIYDNTSQSGTSLVYAYYFATSTYLSQSWFLDYPLQFSTGLYVGFDSGVSPWYTVLYRRR
jgi:hypothetical protein